MDFHFSQGTLPLLVSMPHAGTAVPPEIAARLSVEAQQLPDTDWHLPLLYDFLPAMGVSTLAAHWSRYVVDVNRPPHDTNLYPGQDTTGLLPLDTFHKAPLYLAGAAPSQAEVEQRLALYWQPYHQQLERELARLKALHGYAILWDAHSIASVVPRFFAGKLPDLNFGTADGTSCPASLSDMLVAQVAQQQQFSLAVNGRFKGGYITRNYGQPANKVHAIQLEMCQSTYMDESHPFAYRPDLAAQVQPLLRQLIASVLAWGQTQAKA